MKRTQAALAAALVFALALPLASCSGANRSSAEPSEGRSANSSAESLAYPDEEGVAATEEYGSSGGSAGYDIANDEPAKDAGINSVSSITATGASSAQDSQKLIYTATLSLDTTDYQKSVDGLRALMARCEAFAEFENEWTYGNQDLHALSVTVRVPAERYDELMGGMGDIEGTLTDRSAQVTNITRQYADNEAVIEGLEIQEKRLLEMMEEAESIEDMILVEERLSEVQLELNLARSNREDMDADVSLSTVTVTITEVRRPTTTAQSGYGTRVGNAFVDMWDSFVEGLGDLGIALIYAIPAIIIAAVIVLGVLIGVRRHRKKHAAQPSIAQTPENPDTPQGA